MLFRDNRPIRVIATAAMLITSLYAFVTLPQKAEAGGSACRTDPIIVLTNGAQLQMDARMTTNIENVRSVVYTIHAPVGVRVALILYTDNPLRNVERVVFHADGPPDQYSITTVVELASGGADVTTTSILVHALGLELDRDRASGRNHQHLRMSLGR